MDFLQRKTTVVCMVLERRMSMTENERLTIDEIIQHCNRTCENTEMLATARGQNQEDITSKGYWEHYQVANYLEELKQYRAIGTVDEVAEMSNSYINYFHKVRRYEAIGTVEQLKTLQEDYWKLNEMCKKYSAIGTMEELQKMKGVITDFPIDCGSPISNVEEIWNQLKKYLAIGTIEEFKALKEKSVAKKVIRLSDNEYYDYKCPTCGMPDKDCMGKKYCNCGQALEH